jgi:UDP-glucuronate 4-epimerase
MILVTGGAGFIGSHLVDRLLGRNEDVVCLDDFNDFYDPGLKRDNIREHRDSKNYRLIEADIRDPDALAAAFDQYDIRKVVHLAARAGVRPSLSKPLLYADVNVRATIELLELAVSRKVEQFVFASSSSVYGANTKLPFSEDDPILRTVSPYAATKYAAELFCHTYHHLHGMPTTCLRFFTVYGPRQRPEMAIHKFARLIYDAQPIPMYGDGSTARDYTYIDDIVAGLVAAIDRPFDFEVINLGESRTVTLAELIGVLETCSGKKATVDRMDMQPGDVEVTYADVRKAARLLDYRPETPIETGIEKFLEWFERVGSSADRQRRGG